MGHLDRDIPGFDEDLEDLTPEEAEDREAILDDREGRLAGPIVRCGRWTNRVVELDGNTTAKFESTKITNRCTVLYKPTNCTGPIKLTCSKFLVDNRRGDKFLIKVDDSKPRVFCDHEKPTSYYPAYSFQRMKVWFSAAVDSKFPNSGATCKIKCAEVL